MRLSFSFSRASPRSGDARSGAHHVAGASRVAAVVRYIPDGGVALARPDAAREGGPSAVAGPDRHAHSVHPAVAAALGSKYESFTVAKVFQAWAHFTRNN